jgi:hypothetical protein
MNPWFKRHYQRFYITGIAALVLLAACSSGGESGTGLQQNQTTVGEINGFGSIYVNGTKFNTDQATVTIDGIDDDETNLAVGMVVTVKGSVNTNGTTGTANEVTTKTEVKGVVLGVDFGAKTLNVMHQTVKYSNDTHFKSEVGGITVIDDLVTEDTVVSVSGFSDGQGDIYATYIKAIGAGGTASEVKLNGIVTNVNGTETSGSFLIGDMDITYQADTQFKGLSREQLFNETNLYVSIEGANYMFGNPVTATEIERQSVNSEPEGTELEIEGVVTGVIDVSNPDAGQFLLNGRLITYNVYTDFESGAPADIAVDMKLEVEGMVQADGSIVADEISLREESDMEFEGTVTNAGDNSLQLTASDQSVLTVIVNQYTSYKDEVDETNRYFSFSDIMQGMDIDAKYYVDPQLGNVATSIERISLSD